MRLHTPAAALCLAIIAFIGSLPAARAESVRLVRLSAPTLEAVAGTTLPGTFSVRVERATGEPIPGVRLAFSVNGWSCWIPGPPDQVCPEDHWYGGFETGEEPLPGGIWAVSGPDGIATVTTAFRAGHPPAKHTPFVFDIYPYASRQTTPGGFTITLEEALRPIGGYLVAATSVVILAGPTSPVPGLDVTALGVLALLLGSAGAWRLRSGRARPTLAITPPAADARAASTAT